ncbi:MAG TPA: hypothetical protein VH796_17040 [Nitrososphaeraceae archaeon]|jgi:hypothetical protein
MPHNKIKYMVESYTKEQMMDIGSEFIEINASNNHNSVNVSRSFWRIDYCTGIAIFWSDKSEDVKDLIRYEGTAENYLKQRGCEDIQQEDDLGNRYTFRSVEEVKA